MANEHCPNPSHLSAFVSGSIAEDAAENLSLHLDTCLVCQEKVDTLARQGDSLLKNLRRPAPSVSQTAGATVKKLMEQAEVLVAQRPRETFRAASPESKTTISGPVPIDVFVRELRHSGLMSNEEIDEALASTRTREVQSLALELVNQDRLTRYQAGLLARGKSKGLVLGNYEVLDKVGEGGMGLVFKARHRRMERIVALKVLPTAAMKSETSVRRFRREVQTAAKLNHENIVLAYDADEGQGVHFLVMEYVDGKDLSRIVKTQGALSVEHTIQCVTQTATALQYAHDLGIIHRDIKPQNLLIDSRGTVKVLDLGLARPEFDDNVHLSKDLTNSGVVMGTLDYVAPEQAANSKNADARSDIYSLGCTMFFLLTGRRMYSGDTPVEKLLAHREDPIPSIQAFRSDVSTSLEAVFRRMVAKRPDDRYQSMVELIAELQSVESSQDSTMLPLTAAETVVDSGPLRVDDVSIDDLPVLQTDFPSDPPFVHDTLTGSQTLPMLPQVPSWATAQQRSRIQGLSPRALWIIGGILAGLLLLALLAVAWPSLTDSVANSKLLSTIDSTLKISRAPELMVNGGDGHVMIVVPRNKFWYPDYINVRKAFEGCGVHVAVATVDGQQAAPEQGEKGVVTPNVAVNNASAREFDAVVFCGARDMSEFEGCEFTQSFIREMQAYERCIGAICRGQYALGYAGIMEGKPYLVSNNVTKHKAESMDTIFKADPRFDCTIESGDIVLAKHEGDAAGLAKQIIAKLKSKQKANQSKGKNT